MKNNLKSKSLYWKEFPEQYTVDENGNIHIHDNADEEVKKSYKQYTYEQMMGNYFVDDDEEEEIVERTFSISDKAMDSLNNSNKDKKMNIPELQLKKDYSMYSWMSHKEYYDIVDGEYVFKEDTPQDILENYNRYKKQLNKIDKIKNPKSDNIIDFLLDQTGISLLFKKKKKK